MDAHRLSQIETLWSVVRRAHAGQAQAVRTAQEELLARYGGAVRRYLLGALRDANAADEVFQEFALRFVRGDFRRADPERGRFRGFVKTVLFRLVVDHHRRRKFLRLESDQFEPATPEDSAAQDEEFAANWRGELLARAWAALKEVQQETGKPLFVVLRLRVDQPDATAEALAQQLSAEFGKTIAPGNVRVILHRARQEFAGLLLDEVVHSLEDASEADLEQELIELNLFEYCRPALERRQEG